MCAFRFPVLAGFCCVGLRHGSPPRACVIVEVAESCSLVICGAIPAVFDLVSSAALQSTAATFLKCGVLWTCSVDGGYVEVFRVVLVSGVGLHHWVLYVSQLWEQEAASAFTPPAIAMLVGSGVR